MREQTFVFRTVEDPTIEGRPERCPFDGANVFLGGRMHALEFAAPGAAQALGPEIGFAAACAEVAGPLVPGTVVPFYAEFAFAHGDSYSAEGVARVVSADIPEPGVVQAGCTLRLLTGPAGLIGGSATSASLFDPGRTLAAGTGSVWTIRAYFLD